MKERIDRIEDMIKDIHTILTGNGNPKEGLYFRVSWLEKVVYFGGPVVFAILAGINSKEALANLISKFVN